MKVTDYIARFLYAQGVDHIFEVTGGMITHLLDSIHEYGKIRVVSTHHEQAAAIAADTFATLTGVPGVALATSGPGAVNLLNGIACCYFESVPAVFITGQVNRHEIKRDLPVRQLGFQETDIVSMALPITKASWLVDSVEDVPKMLEEAFRLAISGRPGPVLLDIPMDIQRADIEIPPPVKVERHYDPEIQHTPEQLQEALTALQQAKRPVILAGGGILCAGAVNQFRRFAELTGVPVVHSLMAIDFLPFDHPQRVGLLGAYGNRWANLVMGKADVVLVLGSRLDIRQTGADVESFKGDRVIYHVDCEMGEVNNRVKGCYPIHAYLDQFLTAATDAAKTMAFDSLSEWETEISDLKAMWPDTHELQDIQGINPNTFIHQLSHNDTQVGAYVVDCGQHQMWAAQSIEIAEGQRYITSGGMAPMGFALPAAIGASMAMPGRPVVSIAGDAAFQMNIQELQTVVRNHLPIKMIILNNGCHGMVRQFQQSYFEERYHSTIWGYSHPDFCRIAEAYGIQSATVHNPEDVTTAIQQMLADPEASYLLDVKIDQFTNVYPKIVFGKPMTEMEPYILPRQVEQVQV